MLSSYGADSRSRFTTVRPRKCTRRCGRGGLGYGVIRSGRCTGIRDAENGGRCRERPDSAATRTTRSRRRARRPTRCRPGTSRGGVLGPEKWPYFYRRDVILDSFSRTSRRLEGSAEPGRPRACKRPPIEETVPQEGVGSPGCSRLHADRGSPMAHGEGDDGGAAGRPRRRRVADAVRGSRERQPVWARRPAGSKTVKYQAGARAEDSADIAGGGGRTSAAGSSRWYNDGRRRPDGGIGLLTPGQATSAVAAPEVIRRRQDVLAAARWSPEPRASWPARPGLPKARRSVGRWGSSAHPPSSEALEGAEPGDGADGHGKAGLAADLIAKCLTSR